jgi:hypothetical protein
MVAAAGVPSTRGETLDGRRLRLDGTSQELLGAPWRQLTVAQRLTLQHQLDRVEFLARIGLRVSP